MTLRVIDAARLEASIAFASLLGAGAAHSAGCTLSSDLKTQAGGCEVVAWDVGAARRADARTDGAGGSASAAYAVEPAPGVSSPPAGEASLNTAGSEAIGLSAGGDGPELRRIDGTVLCSSRTGGKISCVVKPRRPRPASCRVSVRRQLRPVLQAGDCGRQVMCRRKGPPRLRIAAAASPVRRCICRNWASGIATTARSRRDQSAR